MTLQINESTAMGDIKLLVVDRRGVAIREIMSDGTEISVNSSSITRIIFISTGLLVVFAIAAICILVIRKKYSNQEKG
jgi:hypothetical protein